VVNEEKLQQEVVQKFRPWHPWLRAIPVPLTPEPPMTPQEALLIIQDDRQNLYDGGSGNGIADRALAVLWEVVDSLPT
jgi:hypothetical protein